MPKPLSDTFPEICHYTTIGGLTGILQSQTLWATHYAHLNDAVEIRHFSERLKDVLKPVVEEAMLGLKYTEPAKYKFLKDHGGIAKIAQEDTGKLVKLMFDNFLGGEGMQPLAEPYVTSFCAPLNEKERDDGLLSQWRGYGIDGGYAIYFDTKELHELLRKEAEKWEYLYLAAGDVLYDDASDETITEEIGEQIHDIKRSIQQLYRVIFSGEHNAPTAHEVLGPLLPAILRCSCLYKHYGFREEKEVRIVAIPQSAQIRELAKGQGRSQKHEKLIKNFIRRGIPVPYLALFEGITTFEMPLPVTRIIVGPHSEKNNRRKDIESFLKQNSINAPVTVSGIPYLGR